MKIKFFQKENNFRKKEFTLNANLYWELALCLALILTIGSCLLGYHIFSQINKKFTPLAPDQVSLPKIDQDRIKKVLNYFSDRANKSSEIINSPSPIVDPSK